MERVICVLIGYLFGLFQTGYLYGRMNGIDIRSKGSGNSGTTNALRVLGKKAGLIVFAGDVLKLCLACYVSMYLFNNGLFHNGRGLLLSLYTGLGVVLGHNFPFYLHFKGGKGIAVTAGMLLVLDWRLTLIEMVLFLAVVILTRYVSLGSIAVVTGFFVLWVVMGGLGMLAVSGSLYMESSILVFVWAVMAIWRHRANIERLRTGTENKLF